MDYVKAKIIENQNQFNQEDGMCMNEKYIASISVKIDKTVSWLKHIEAKSFTHTILKEKRLLFQNKKDAESTLETLQAKYPYIFTLVNETK